ncbi:non-ribosomal peptide synthetase [Scytonema sp. UIC 10036]|uniref:non-ribosomal peptide synthetase n=1 Tax=Scytonema sp. UIC 10036 TaxID=2304196 RepID=UPI001FA9DCB3|nr:non-ribosomal peptide synthetase [Scytonema sp. UIC 10036]
MNKNLSASSSIESDKQLNYWKQQLANASLVLELPTDKPRPSVQRREVIKQSFILNRTLLQALYVVSQQEGITVFSTLLAAFQTLLYRYSRQEDILVGCPIMADDRHLMEAKASTLVLRTNMSGNPSFRDLLQKVRLVVLEARANQGLPFEKLVEELQIERSPSYHPLFQVMFALQNTSEQTLEFPGQTITPEDLDSLTSKLDLTLLVEEQEKELKLQLVYQCSLFSPERINCILNQYQYLLEQIVADTNKPINSYSLVTPETRPLLPDPSAVLPEPRYELVTDMFASRANLTPEQFAICQGDCSWTYGELARHANAIAKFLLSHNIKPGDTVAVCGLKSFGLIASMLGVLLSRGVLLTLDSNLPRNRQQLMLEAAKAKHILYVGARRPEDSWMQEIVSVDVTSVDSDKGLLLDSEAFSNLETVNLPELDPDDAAYIFFTSGTTGTPKGVLGCHKGLSHFLSWQRQTFAITPQDRSAQLTGLSFDVVLRDIFLPLTSGATLCLLQDSYDLRPDRIITWLERERISILHTVPALAQSWLVGVPQAVSLPSLRWVFFAGEPLTDTLVRQWRKFFPLSREIVNLYGPTETTLAKCFYQVPVDPSPGVQPVGLPLPETQALVLGENHTLCGIGESGEIVLRTPFRTLGYVNAPEEYQKRFVQNPDRNDKQDLLYYTGDRGRYRLDGSLEILGRLDHQVKIRGIRVELGEIQSVLGQHPGVRENVVLCREDILGEKRLVAYVVLNREQPPTITELRNFLKQQLPEFMVPSVFMLLDKLPLTANGKVNRWALPAPDTSRPDIEGVFVAPRNQVEEDLAGIWSQILRLDCIGIQDNFFELGGHSLQAMQVIGRVRQTFGVEIPLQSLFETPTIASLASAIALKQSQGNKEYQTITRTTNRQSSPLSFAQARLWFLEQLEPNNAAYHIPEVLRLQGDLNVSVLQQSLDAIVTHHEVLRTNFVAEDGNPVQVIREPRAVELKIYDLKAASETENSPVVQQLLQDEVQRPFDLTSDLMLRGCLIVRSPQEHILLLVMHHIATDGWSKSIVFEQLTTLYQVFVNGLPNPLPELPIQYADYANWQRQWLCGEVLKSQLNYWRQQIAGANPVLELPTDRPRPPVQTYRGAKQSFLIPKDLFTSVQALSRQEGVTLFMTLLAAFQTLLYRYSGQEDILVGSPIAGRNHAETEGLIGFFVNTLVFRSNLSGNLSFRELLQKVRLTAMSAYANQDLPFEKLVQELQPERSLSYHPLFQVMFVLQNTPRQTLELPGLTVTPVEIDSLASQLDLALSIEETEQGLRGIWEYNTDLFDVGTIERLNGHFQTLLEAIVAFPEQVVGQLPMLTSAEHQLLSEWNNTQVDYPQRCIHELFEEQVKRSPNAVAAVFENEQLTYQELNNRANQLAHYLKTLGVEPGVLVGICMERSLEVVVGQLGILKAGGAYVPLDPEYPKDRLTFLIEDTQVPVILTHKKCIESLPTHEAQLVCLDSDWELISGYSQQNPDCQIRADSLLYIIYTSGSTGKPKGVMIPHRGISNMLHWRQETFRLTAQDKVLQTYSLSFDPSVWQIFWPLSFGAQLVMARPHGHKDTGYLVNEIIERQITVIGLVPSIMNALLEEKKFEQCRSLRHVTTGGEVLSVELMDRFHERLNLGNLLVNCYGPTEASIDVTAWLSQPGVQNTNVPIGRPIPNVQTYILDANLQPVPVGHVGELHIGGIGLATGYLNRPELTQEKFIPNSWSHETGAKLYKTGDLARYLSDGNIEFLGRIDYQVKIRGFRIELGEVEASLSQHPAVQQTLVMAREDVPGDKRLVAYVVLNPDSNALNSNELRSFLKECLPEHMVPSAFVILDKMPLYPNGKVNRRELPAPDASHFSARNNFVAPRTSTEEALAEIWSQVLGIEQVSIYDNFFELGGHSLLVTQAISRSRQAFGIEMPLSRFFETPRIADLAEFILQIQAETIKDDEINSLLAELDNLSDEEAQFLLANG